MVVVDFDETAGDMQLQGLAALDIGEDSGLQARNQRRVPGQNPKLTTKSRHSNHLDGLREHAPFRCDYFELQLFRHNETKDEG